MTGHWLKDLLYFIGVTVVLRFLIVNWLTSKAVDVSQYLTIALERWLVRSETEGIIWVHFKLKAMRQGHTAKTPVECSEGRCTTIVK